MGHTLRERARIWEEGKEIKRRTGMELHELVSEAIKQRLDREITEMAFKGSRPGKGGGKGKDDKADVLAMYRELVRIQSEVIHALAAALMATEEVDEEDEDESEDEENEDKDKE